MRPIGVIIAAGGSSVRFGAEKQLVSFCGEPLFVYSVREFLPICQAMVLVVPAGQEGLFLRAAEQAGCASPKLRVVVGGNCRTESVRNGLAALPMTNGLVAIHDAARPLATRRLLERLAEAAEECQGGAVPGHPQADTMLSCDKNSNMTGAVPRDGVWAVSTPQVFDLQKLRKACRKFAEASFTDDAQLLHHAGGTVRIVPEEEENLKVTYPPDLVRAEQIFAARKKSANRRLILASPIGFCNGVRRAVEMFRQLTERYPGKTIYVLHELVHNRAVTEIMIAKGARFVENVEEVPRGSILLLGAHGCGPSVKEICSKRNLEVHDAVCPLVVRLQNIAINTPPTMPVIVLGDRTHPEIQALLDHLHGRQVFVIDKPQEADSLPPLQTALFLSQTTRKSSEVKQVGELLQKKIPDLQNRADVCSAVLHRQESVARLSQECDVIYIIGSVHSSNARRLAEIAAGGRAQARLIERAEDLNDADLQNANIIGLAAGTSTPDWSIQGVEQRLNALHFISEQQKD